LPCFALWRTNLFKGLKTVVGSVGSSSAEFEEALQVLPRLPLEPFLGHILPLEEFKKAWECSLRRDHLKTLIEVLG